MNLTKLDAEDVVRAHGLDPADWWASEIRSRQWQQGKTPAWSLRAKLQRRAGPDLVKALKATLANIGKLRGKQKFKAGGTLAEVHLNDAHIGAWEQGDLKAYSRTLWRTAARLVARALEGPNGVERVLLVVNGDWLHADTVRGETTSGTRLEDVAIPYAQMFKEALGSLVGIVNWIAPQRPVDVLILPGNHDFHALFAVGQALDALYQDNSRVEIHSGTDKHAFREWGCVLLGFTHGDTGALKDLPGLMATERREAWGRTTWHEWHTGHVHAQAQFERAGCRVRCIPALTKRNEWAKNQGFAEAARGAECYLWHRERGYLGHLHESPAED